MFQNIFIEVTRGQPTNPLAIYGSTLEEMSSSVATRAIYRVSQICAALDTYSTNR